MFYEARSDQFRKLVGGDHNVGLPRTFQVRFGGLFEKLRRRKEQNARLIHSIWG